MAPRGRATPSAFRPTIPVAVSAGYGSPGKLGSPSRRLRAQAQTGGDLAADVGTRLARLSGDIGLVADEHVTEEEVAVPVVEEKRAKRSSKGTNNAIGNESFGIEAGVGRFAAVEEEVSAAPARFESEAPIVESIEDLVPVSAPFWSSQRTILTLLTFWLFLCPLLAGILSVARDVPWLATTKSLATFGAFPASSRFGALYSDEFGTTLDIHTLRAGLATTGDLTSLRHDLSNGIQQVQNDVTHLRAQVGDLDIDGIHNDMSHLRAQVNTLSSNIPAKGASTQFSGGLPSHIVPSYGSSRVNLFSNNFGTVVDPYLTSPSRAETIHYDNFLLRWLYPEGDIVPLTYSPAEALNPWEDQGDCWCTPNVDISNTASTNTDSVTSESSNGLAQIAMLLPQPVIPTDFIIEHIEKDRTIDSGSTPKEFELLIQVHDSHVRERIRNAAESWLPADDWRVTPQEENHRWETERPLDATWVKIGRWTYDLYGPQNIQSFRIPRWLGEFGEFGVTKVVVRTRSNWGNAPFTCFYRLKMFGHLLAVEE